jgi:hypothetical protein
MQRPNPWILLMGGIALLNVAMLVGGLHAAAWARYAGMGTCATLGVTSIGLGVRLYLEKKPERPKFQPRRRRPPGA